LSILARLLCRGVKTNTEVVGLHPHSNSNKPLVWQMVCYSQLGYAKDLTMGVLLNILLNIQHLCYLQVMQSKPSNAYNHFRNLTMGGSSN